VPRIDSEKHIAFDDGDLMKTCCYETIFPILLTAVWIVLAIAAATA
jgi:hypothetical protein